jgi:hypothetical protein
MHGNSHSNIEKPPKDIQKNDMNIEDIYDVSPSVRNLIIYRYAYNVFIYMYILIHIYVYIKYLYIYTYICINI